MSARDVRSGRRRRSHFFFANELGSPAFQLGLPGTAAVRPRDDFQQVTVRALEIDAASAIVAVGGFVALSPWLFAFRYDAARLESVASGVLVVAISIAALIAFADWEELAVLALGLWLIASPWALGFPVAAAMKIHIGVGLGLVYLAGLELWLIHYNHELPGNGRP
jgi:hypothetical protein